MSDKNDGSSGRERAEASAPVNPFLASAGAGQAPPLPPRKKEVIEPAPDTRPRRVMRPPTYELRVQPGVESPVVKDPHREFRKGGWKKPLAFVALAAAILGALTWLVKPAAKEEVPFERLYAPPKQEDFAIGTSLGPERIPEAELRHTPEKPTSERKEAPPRPSGIVTQKQFADEFKSQAQKSE